MKKQTKMEYVSPSISEMDLMLKDFIADLINTQDLKDMTVTDVPDPEDDPFWSLQN